jgi:hypothetical protein
MHVPLMHAPIHSRTPMHASLPSFNSDLIHKKRAAPFASRTASGPTKTTNYDDYGKVVEQRLAYKRPERAPGLREKRAFRLLRRRKRAARQPKGRKRGDDYHHDRGYGLCITPKRGTPGRGYVCHQCGIPGHWIEECTAPPVIMPPPSHYICHSCPQGHWMEDCGTPGIKRLVHHPIPPSMYVCKLCRGRGHWAQNCHLRARSFR